jgi:hemerythrin superfamily protein
MVTQAQPQDGLQLLTADHRKVEELFAKFEKASGTSAKEALVRQICTELKVHTMIEEEIYYPEIRGKVEEDALDEAYVEHDSAKLLVNELESADPDETYYDAKVKVLQELIEHHVKEEEKQRDNLFQQTRAAEIDLDALGARLAARKAELMDMAGREGLPPAQAATLAHEEI